MSNITPEQQRQLKEMPVRQRKAHAAMMRHTNHLAMYRPKDDKAMENFLKTCGIVTEKAVQQDKK